MNYLSMSIQDLARLKDELIGKAQSIDDAAKAENRELTDAEDAQANDFLSQADEISNHINKRNQRNERAQKAASLRGNATEPAKPALTTSGLKHGFEEDPAHGFKSRAEFFSTVMNVGISGKCNDERLNYLNTVGSDEHSTSNDPYGGFLIPEQFVGGLLTVDPETDFLAGRTQAVPLSSNRAYLNARVDKNHSTSVTGGLRVYRRAEASTVEASRMETERVYLNAESLMGIAYASEELIQDSPVTLAAMVGNSFAQEFSSKLLNERINGTGVGEFEGVLNAPSLITVAKESGQSADTLVYANLAKMYARCWGKDRAIWIANHNVLPQLITMTTNNNPVWQPSLRDGVPMTVLGRPIFFTEYCSTLGDAGDIIFGDWSQYLEGTRQGISSAESMHVRFVYNERAFRFTLRNDGRSWWRSPLTPKNGDTLSPFVTLAARA